MNGLDSLMDMAHRLGGNDRFHQHGRYDGHDLCNGLAQTETVCFKIKKEKNFAKL